MPAGQPAPYCPTGPYAWIAIKSNDFKPQKKVVANMTRDGPLSACCESGIAYVNWDYYGYVIEFGSDFE